jgi:hypothetical protein
VSLQFCCWRFFLLHTDPTKMAGPRHDVLAAFNKAKAVFFYKTMTSTMVADGSGSEVMRLVSTIMHLFCCEVLVLLLIPRPDTVGLRLNVGQELPSQFAIKHGEEMNQVVALVRPASCGGGEWSLLFEGCYYRNYPSRVCVYGGGWRDFVLDNGISIGEFLVFELVDRSRLIVHVYPRDDQFGIHPRGLCRSVEEESGLLHPPRSGNADQKDLGQSRPSRPSSTPVEVAWDHIGFKKTMCASHCPNCKTVNLVSIINSH